MAQVTLDRLSKTFENVHAVREVSLDIADGEFVVLVGPSGCGKSTTLRMIAGLEESTSGTIQFGAETVNELSPRERNIAMVFQSYALYPHMTVERNMGFALEQSSETKASIAKTVRETADMLGISQLLQRKPKALSGGQRQRVAMGRAIVRRPSVFLFDEPLSNLDAALRTQMRVEIKKLHQVLNTTVVYVTHDQIEAMTLADRIVVMDQGKIVQVGSPMEVYQRPRTRFVASFIGAPRMNFVPCCVIKASGDALKLKFSDDQSWTVPTAHLERFAPFVGRSIEIGIRPEHLGVGTDVPPDSVCFEARAEVVEQTGADTMVYFTLGQAQVTARLASKEKVEVRAIVPIIFSFANLYIVDLDTGLLNFPA